MEGIFRLFFLLQICSIYQGQADGAFQCGKTPQSSAHITNSEAVGTWPWMASLGHFDENGEKWKHKCGTTLISQSYFLTAAHCAKEILPDWQILTGTDDLNLAKNGRNVKIFDIKENIIHPLFNGNAYFDVALLRTDEVQFTDRILPICLPLSSSNDLNKYDNDQMELIGWGSSSLTQSTSSTLKRVEVKVFTQRYCNSTHYSGSVNPIYKEKVEKSVPDLFQGSVLCAGQSQGRNGSCKGDTGGPLFYKDDETESYFQIAVVHGGIGECGSSDFPGIHVRLDDQEIFEFIKSNTAGSK